MRAKPLVVLPQAERDLRTAVLFYRHEAGVPTAVRFMAALERQYRFVTRNPGSGSARLGVELRIEGLRTSRLKRFPYLIFYIERDDRIEIRRVLHAMRDIPASLHE